MNKVTHKQLKDWISYNPESGLFHWTGNLKWTEAGKQVGCLDSEGYVVIKMKGRMYKAHRLAWLYVTGEWPSGEVDHINYARADNRFCNLRDCTTQQNLQARRFCKSATGLRNVFHSGSKFRVRVWVNGRNQHFGTFEDIELAELVAQEARRHSFGEFAGVS